MPRISGDRYRGFRLDTIILSPSEVSLTHDWDVLVPAKGKFLTTGMEIVRYMSGPIHSP